MQHLVARAKELRRDLHAPLGHVHQPRQHREEELHRKSKLAGQAHQTTPHIHGSSSNWAFENTLGVPVRRAGARSSAGQPGPGKAGRNM